MVVSGGRKGLALGAIGAALAFAVGVLAPQPAAAQGLFGTLFGGFGEYRRPPARVGAPAYAAPTQDERYPTPDLSPRVERPAGEARGAGTHCVRLCDGRYFPLPRNLNGARLDPARVCTALCPAARTQVFNGGNMNYAVAADGTRYADLDNAFAFRDKNIPDCSCTGNGPGGLAQLDLESDPTLRAGDVVVTAAGPAMFRGSAQFPHKAADFTPIDDSARLNGQMRQKLNEIQVDPTARSVVPVQKVETGTDEKPAKSRTRRTRAQVAVPSYPDFPR